MRQLTEKEEELMRKLWTKDEMTAREVLEMYPDPRPHFNTIATVLRVLENKGWVKHRPIGNTHLYRASVSEDELGRKSLKSIVSKFFNGSISGMMNSLMKNEQLSKEEINEIWDIVNNKKNES